ncbi:MAG: carotenoid oxygenase family protein [Pseudohongiellaceae bacterium]
MKTKKLNRRDFSKGLLTLGAGLLLDPAVSYGNQASETSPWAAGFKGVQQDLEPLTMTVHGQIPDACRGTLYRNGPALFERQGQRYSHWFDPDGMIQSFTLGQNGVKHKGRFVRTAKFNREQDAGRFLYNGAGSKIEGSFPARNNDGINAANINVQPFQGELLALWEAGSPYRIDPDSLETLGKHEWRDDLQGVPFSAHPRIDDKGEMWNIGSLPMPGGSALVLYHIGKDGKLKKTQLHRLEFSGYQHDFVLTPNYVIALNSSAVAANHGETFVDMFEWQASRPSQLLVFNKSDFSLVKTIEVPPAFVFHFGNAWEVADKVVFTASQYKDAQFMKHGMALMAQQKPGPYHDESALLRYSVDIKAGGAQIEKLHDSIEFPGFDRRHPFMPQDLIGVSDTKLSTNSMQSAISKVNPETGNQHSYDYGSDVIVEEPQFIADASSKLGSGFILHSFLNYKTERTGIAILRSEAVADGPVAIAEMDRCLPLGFHGCFLPAST